MSKIWHCVERHDPADSCEATRKELAFASWHRLYDAGAILPCHYWSYVRTSSSDGDPRLLPYLKDILRQGLKSCVHSQDIILWTNDDTILNGSLPSHLKYAMRCKILTEDQGAVCSHAVEFDATNPPRLDDPYVKWRREGRHHKGRDMFAFRSWWLKKYWDEIPDFIVGAPHFDWALAALIRAPLAQIMTPEQMYRGEPPFELIDGSIGHIDHPSAWVYYGEGSYSAQHNRALSEKLLARCKEIVSEIIQTS